MSGALIAGLFGLLGLAITFWSNGRLFRERKALREEMDLFETWRDRGDAAQLQSHVDEQVRRYVVRAANRDHSFRRLVAELLSLAALAFGAYIVIAAAVGDIDFSGIVSDPDTVWYAILIGLVLVAIWRIDQWIQSWRASRK